jgi:uncharacterized membrane protein YecN with MAPEG domain
MSDSAISNFSSETQPSEGNPNKNPFVFPVIMLGTAFVFGGAMMLIDAEGHLVRSLFRGNDGAASTALTTLGGVSIAVAHGHSMAMLGNARRKFQVGHPMVAAQSNIPFWNANRGYYNFTEHMPFFLFNFWLAREVAELPCLAGLCCILYGVGRVLYTHDYAYGGPAKRVRGFTVVTFASMTCLGVTILQTGRSLFFLE